MATFITSKSVGQDITIYVETSTGYWKYNHDGTDSSVSTNGGRSATVVNANGEFTLISCLSDGTVSGDITYLDLRNIQITSFDGTGLSSLTYLALVSNQLTSFDGTGLSSLTNLFLQDNQLTTFTGTGLSALTALYLTYNQLTSFDGTGLTSLNDLNLENNPLTLINLTGSNVLQYCYINNPLSPSVNNSLLAQFAANELANAWNYGEFYTTGGRTSAGTTDYDYLIANGWTVEGADLVPTGTGKLRVKGIGQLNP
jgi:hypothetical protein